jgi:hypothetical protein
MVVGVEVTVAPSAGEFKVGADGAPFSLNVRVPEYEEYSYPS